MRIGTGWSFSPRAATLLTLAALLALAGTAGTAAVAGDRAAGAEPVFLQMRVWQHVEDAENIWISARPRGGRWDALGTIPFPLDGKSANTVAHGFHWYRDLAIGDVEVRVWQRYRAPERIYVRACGDACPPRDGQWTPLGMIPLPLDDGHSPSGRYRYGDLTLAVPRGNPGLVSDREHLLALKDALAGTGTLSWSADRATSAWEGVTVAGAPPRVTGLNLAQRDLTGVIWGWLGDLTALTELRLDGNRLTGALPSKLVNLDRLTYLYLRGNALQGCIPPPLRAVEHTDLAGMGLPDCAPPALLKNYPAWDDPFQRTNEGGSYRWRGAQATTIVLDAPPGLAVDINLLVYPGEVGEPPEGGWCPPCLESVFDIGWIGLLVTPTSDDDVWRAGDDSSWLLLDGYTGEEMERSHYAEEDPASFAIIEQIAASVWRNTAAGDDGGWVWP